MSKNNDWKKREGLVFSTNKDFQFESQKKHEESTPPTNKQHLTVLLDKHLRAGKQVTLVRGFAGNKEDLEKLEKSLKSKCGVGGSVKEGEIILQGDLRTKVADILMKEGFKVKKI